MDAEAIGKGVFWRKLSESELNLNIDYINLFIPFLFWSKCSLVPKAPFITARGSGNETKPNKMYGKVLLQTNNNIPGVEDTELPKASSNGKLCFSELEVNTNHYDLMEQHYLLRYCVTVWLFSERGHLHLAETEAGLPPATTNKKEGTEIKVRISYLSWNQRNTKHTIFTYQKSGGWPGLVAIW